MPLSATRKAALKAELEGQKKRGKAKQAQGVHAPIEIEDKYTRELEQIVKQVWSDIKRHVTPLIEKQLLQDSRKSKNPVDAALAKLQGKWAKVEALGLATKTMLAVSKYHEAALTKVIRDSIGVNIGSVIASVPIEQTFNLQVTHNVKLIKTIPRDMLLRVRETITQGIATGSDSFAVNKQLVEDYGISQRRARVIARDQTAKMNGAIDKARQSGLGITHYFWDAVKDSVTRDTHRKNDGKRFAWSNPPPETGHPTDDVNCRCVARPDLSVVARLIS